MSYLYSSFFFPSEYFFITLATKLFPTPHTRFPTTTTTTPHIRLIYSTSKMYIPKRTRLEMFLKRKVSTSSSSRKNNNDTSVDRSEFDKTNNANWSDTCAVYIKDFVLKRRSSSKASRKSIAQQEDTNSMLTVETNLCFDQLSEFQKSYISFPEFNDSSISNESATDSECSSNAQESWRLTTSFSFSSYTSSNI